MVDLICGGNTSGSPGPGALDCTPQPVYERFTLELVEAQVDGEVAEVSGSDSELVVQMTASGQLAVFEGVRPNQDSVFLEPVSDDGESP